jgi:hypothetical protein
MKGNFHVRFLGEETAATPSPYPTIFSCAAVKRIPPHSLFPFRNTIAGELRYASTMLAPKTRYRVYHEGWGSNVPPNAAACSAALPLDWRH